MSTTPRTDADLIAAFTADADEAISAAEFMRQHESAFHGRVGPHEHRVTRLAPILAVALILAVAALLAMNRAAGDRTTASDTSTCTTDFSVAVGSQLDPLPPAIWFTLTYTGISPCAILLAPPKVTVTNAAGNQMGITTGGSVAGHTYAGFTVYHGDTLAFGIGGFLRCYDPSPSRYSIGILIPTAHGSTATLAVPVTIGGRLPASPSPKACSTSPIGDVSALATPSNVAAPTGVITGVLEAVGGPAPGLPRPLPGSVLITNAQTYISQVVSVTADGRYSVAVAPGTYRITGRSPEYGEGAYECEADPSAVVTADHTTSSDVYCEES